MRRLSEEEPESPVIEIHQRQWVIRNWLLGGLVFAVLVLSGLIYAGIRVNEGRDQRNQAVASGQSGKISADLRDAVMKVNAATADARITTIATAAVESRIAAATDRFTTLSGKIAAMEDDQQRLAASFASLQEYADRLDAENVKLHAELAASRGLIVSLQSQRLADSLALAEQNASLNRRISTVADHTSDVDRRVGKSSTSLRGLGGVTAANVAVSLIHLLGTKQATDVKPSSSIDR